MRLDQNEVQFHNLLCKCLYINANKSSFSKASSEEIYGLCKMFEDIDVGGGDEMEQLSIQLTKVSEDPKTLICYSGGFFQSDEKNQFKSIDDYVIYIIQKLDEFQFAFKILSKDGKLKYDKIISNELNYHLDADDAIFKWIDTTVGIKIFAIKFHSFEASHSVKVIFARCLFETTRRESLETILKGEDEAWGRRYMEQEIEIEEESNNQKYPDLEFDLDNIPVVETKEYKEHTNFFTQAKAIDRTFVSRGNIISVYKDDSEQQSLEYICNLPVVKTINGTEFKPSKALMHEEDSKMLILRQDNDHFIYYYDIETGKVIEEYQIDDYNRVKDITSENKLSELTQNKIFLSMNDKNIFKIDPRLDPKNPIASSKIYATNNKFSCITSNANGNFALASANGDVRLYKEMGKNALNLYPGMGDSTKDGKYLLATCKHFLILLSTTKDGKNGFTQKLTKEKPVPRVLTIHPNDISKFGIAQISFSPAHFDESSKDTEKYIISSTGKFLITWSLRHLLAGKIFSYEIKPLNEQVVRTEFQYNKDDKVVVALESQMQMQKTKPK